MAGRFNIPDLEERTASKGPKILVLEDEEIGETYQRGLERLGHNIELAKTVGDACFKIDVSPPAVAVLDCLIGEDWEGGFKVAQRLFEDSPGTKIIFNSAYMGHGVDATEVARRTNVVSWFDQKATTARQLNKEIETALRVKEQDEQLRRVNRELREANNQLIDINRYLSKSTIALLGTYIQSILRDDRFVKEALEDYMEASKVSRFRRGVQPSEPAKIFVTGATGFIGSAYMRHMLENSDAVLYPLVRDGKKPFDQRILIPEKHTSRVHFVRGDITERRLGISEPDWKLLTGKTGVQYLVHCAASTNYEDQVHGENFRLNVLGATRMVEFARNCENLVRLVHLSTAYVEGKPDIAESQTSKQVSELAPLENGSWLRNNFRNKYEETKYLGELVVSSNRDLPYAIVRPTIVVGHSEDGFCNETTIYYFARSFQIAKKALERRPQDGNLRIAIDPEVTKNFICVDDVVAVMEAARLSPYANQKVLHAANPHASTTGDIVRAISGVLESSVDLIGDGPVANPSQVEEALNGAHGIYRDYTHSVTGRDPQWDMGNTYHALREANPSFQFRPLTLEKLTFLFGKYFSDRRQATTLRWK
ncbi:MAG TPA: SDR family oxidoreductase [Candidatus Nanoarchaeia archaeon]|nr:SDR family oxidoreductase [Candidatus Nanoarchaeia archaeon]